jgi:cell division septation protein DedD
MASEDAEYELVLGNKQILSAFFLIVVLFAVFFSLGYSLGHSRGQSEQETASEIKPVEETQGRVRLPDTLLEQAPEPETLPSEVPERPASEPMAEDRSPSTSTGAAEKADPAPPPETPTRTPRQRTTTTAVLAEAAVRGIHLQVAASRVRADAAMMVEELRAKGYPVVLYDGAGDGWYRVLVGPFPNVEAAQPYRERLKADGLDSILRTP